MADDKSSGSWGSSVVVLAFAAVSAAYVAFQQPALVSTRPTEPEYQVADFNGIAQDVDARLWQDPLAAVMRDVDDRRAHNSQSSDPQPRCPQPGDAPDRLGSDALAKNTLVLGVTLPGAPYPEVAETRRRLRYAVLSALHVAQYAPADEWHIGCWRPRVGKPAKKSPQTEIGVIRNDWPAATNAAASGDGLEADFGIGIAVDAAGKAQPTADPAGDQPALPAIVPWEKFDNGQRHVVVLWLDENVLTAGGQPIASLVKLRSQNGYPTGSPFALLGPEDSTTLEATVHEDAPPSNAGFSVYNSGATAEEEKILGYKGTVQQTLFDKYRIQYYRLVETDDQLANSLACELMRRDPNLRLPYDEKQCKGVPAGDRAHDHVVLISDWDTVYGNDLANTVQKNFDPSNPARVRIASYLRGLDGRLPDRKYTEQATSQQSGGDTQQTPAGQAAANQQTAATPETASRFESAEGQSQFDYLRRLAADLKKRDAAYRRTDGGHIAAIGVLGSDVYDKLLILQALRPELPDALFFTTDLDELLLPQDKTRYTRNLLVASSFGLTLNDALQADIPPFRITYQTSIFLATHAAIQNESSDAIASAAADLGDTAVQRVADASAGKAQQPGAAPIPDRVTKISDRIEHWLAPPLLFQIGRTAPRSLQPSDQSNAPCELGRIFDCRSVRPHAPKLYPELGSGAVVSAASILTIVLLTAAFSIRPVRRLCIPSHTHPDGLRRSVDPRVGLLVGGIAIAAAASSGFWAYWAQIADWLTGYGFGEPMSLFEGISLWPPILLRAIGTVLSVGLIFYTLRTLEDNLRETEREMSLPPSPVKLKEELASARTEWRRIHGNIASYPTLSARITALLWFDSLPCDESGRPRLSFAELTSGFGSGRIARCIRALVATILMFSLEFILWLFLGGSEVPARGPIARDLFLWITIPEVFVSLFLIFLVADASLLSRAFIKRLTAVSTIWPTDTLGGFRRKFVLDGANLADWIDMHFLARRTRSITRIIYFPFIALAFLIVSRSPLFDDFVMPMAIIVTHAISIAVVIGSAVALRSAAERARAVACEHINAQIIAADSDEAPRLEKLLEDVNNLNEGAFAPWTRQPVVGAVLLPLITYGGTWLLHLYALPGI